MIRLFVSQIVRDYTLASHKESEIQLLHRSFITTLLDTIDAKSQGKAAHTALYTFACTSLVYNIRAAVKPPFATDDLAMRLLLHMDGSLVTHVLASVKREDVDALAEHFKNIKTEEGQWNVSKLFYAMGIRGAGIGSDDRRSYLLGTVSALSQVSRQSHPGALSIEMEVLSV